MYMFVSIMCDNNGYNIDKIVFLDNFVLEIYIFLGVFIYLTMDREKNKQFVYKHTSSISNWRDSANRLSLEPRSDSSNDCKDGTFN